MNIFRVCGGVGRMADTAIDVAEVEVREEVGDVMLNEMNQIKRAQADRVWALWQL